LVCSYQAIGQLARIARNMRLMPGISSLLFASRRDFCYPKGPMTKAAGTGVEY